MAASLDKKIAEAVKRCPVLYYKSCKDFKDNNTKKNAWEDVAKIAGLSSGMLYYRSEKLSSKPRQCNQLYKQFEKILIIHPLFSWFFSCLVLL